MKTERRILLAFILNLLFSIFELLGGIITGSIAIASDAMHDAADAASIGIAYFMEKKSRQQPDEHYTYGYLRYSTIGGFLTTLILLFGSVIMLCNALIRFIHPTPVNYDGMIFFAVIGVCVNLGATIATGSGKSLNQKAVNLHMLEDVLGWIIVLVGAIVMRFTEFVFLDPILSISVSIFILFNAVGNLKAISVILLEKAPTDISVKQIRQEIGNICGVLDVHHVHVWSMDGQHNYATVHIVTDQDPHLVKVKVRKALAKSGINHVTLETETSTEHCDERNCYIEHHTHTQHNHHHMHVHSHHHL